MPEQDISEAVRGNENTSQVAQAAQVAVAIPEAMIDLDKKKEKRKRLNLDLAMPAFQLLEKLSRNTGKNMADVLRTGLALYGIAYEAHSRGQSIGVIEKDKVVKEIVIT
jgi:hypothetical protein